MARKFKILSISFSILVLVMVFNFNRNNEEINENSFNINVTKDNDVIGSKSNISAVYVDAYNTLNELATASGLVVKGTAGSVIEYRKLGTVTEFNIEESIQGIDNKVIKIIQLNDSKLIEAGKEYVLVLDKDYENNTYYILGGNQGIFEESNEKIITYNDSYDEIIDNISESKSNNKISADNLDQVFDIFSKYINN